MAEQDNIAVIALLVSLIALVVALGQLLQTVFGTAEGYRRTNQQTMSVFAQTRDRRFYWSELRYETKFSTPHFRYVQGGDESLTLPVPLQKLWTLRKTDFTLEARSKAGPDRPILPIGWSNDEHKDEIRVKHLNLLIRSSQTISKLQRFQNLMDTWFRRSLQEIVPAQTRPYAATWLILLERLYEDALGFNQREAEISYICERSSSETIGSGVHVGPDPRQVKYPAIESRPRSWDLLPPDVVRPVASISLGDLLTLCYRFGLSVDDISSKGFNANGNGHHFGALTIQGLGMLVEYRSSQPHDPDLAYKGKDKFIPCENADKLAFGIIPRNGQLGLDDDWPIMTGYTGREIPEAMRRHFQGIGVSETNLERVTDGDNTRNNDVCRTFGETLLLLAPFLSLDGLGMVKYVPPIPWEWQDGTLLSSREGRLTLWHRMQQKYAGSEDISVQHVPRRTPLDTGSKSSDTRTPTSPSMQRRWVYNVLDFLIRKYPMIFKRWLAQLGMFEKNAYTQKKHIFIADLRLAFLDADNFLQETFCPASGPVPTRVEADEAKSMDIMVPGKSPTYKHLVAAHLEMAIDIQAEVYRRKQEAKGEGKHKGFRKGPDVPHTLPKLTEMMHRYIDEVEGETLVRLYRDKTQDVDQAPDVEDDQIRDGWYTMMLRAILWALAHHPVKNDKLPYPSRFWNDNALVFIV